MKPKLKIALGGKVRGPTERILKHILADEFLLSAATRDYCQNITGPHFQGLKKLLDRQYRQVELWMGQVAGRVSAASSLARGSLNQLARFARVSAPAGAGLAIRTMTAELHALHEGLARQLRVDVAICSHQLQDARTADFLRELLHFHDTAAGLLRSLLESPRKGCD